MSNIITNKFGKIDNQPNAKSQQKISIDLSKCDNIKCECECDIFTQILVFKRIPALMIGANKDAIQPIPIVICTKCGKELPEM